MKDENGREGVRFVFYLKKFLPISLTYIFMCYIINLSM